jgi:hypothetical protein
VIGFALVTGVIAAFFVIGIAVGWIAVVAMSALRTSRSRRGNRPRRLRDGTGSPHGDGGLGWEEPPGPDQEDNGHPRWPGG